MSKWVVYKKSYLLAENLLFTLRRLSIKSSGVSPMIERGGIHYLEEFLGRRGITYGT